MTAKLLIKTTALLTPNGWQCCDRRVKTQRPETQEVRHYNLHTRITFRGMVEKGETYGHLAEIIGPLMLVYTKEQRLQSYECHCIERGIKPFHYSQEEFDTIMREFEESQEERYEEDFAYEEEVYAREIYG